MKSRILVILVALWTLSAQVWAAPDGLNAAIDTPWVMVGQPRVLHLEVTVPRESQVIWPQWQRQGGFEAVDMEDAGRSYLLEFGPKTRFEVDSIVSGELLTLTQDLQFFAFDSAAMVVKPIAVVVRTAAGADTLYSDVMALRCEQPFESVPEDPQAMQGLKEILEPEFVLWDYFQGVFGIWLILLVLVAIGFLILYLILRFRKREVREAAAPVRLDPPHVIAMDALLQLQERHLWEAGRFKEYHTELTDILRRYLEKRYQVAALESTTDEIMSELVELQISQKSSFNNLREVLQLADMVKFAKYAPSAEENQISFYNSRLFVEQTKEVEVKESPKETPGSAEADKA